MGGIAATALALWPPIAGLPLGLAVILPLLGGTLAGAFWGGIAGVMKVRFGTNEVITHPAAGLRRAADGLLVRAVDGAAAPAADLVLDLAGIAADPRLDQAAAA